MGFYIGDSEKFKISLGGDRVHFIFADVTDAIIKLFSSDDYILKSSDGLYLIPKESDK